MAGTGSERRRAALNVKVHPITVKDLEERLASFEERYGVPSERLVDAFKRSPLRETPDFHEWSRTYRAWKLATKPGPPA